MATATKPMTAKQLQVRIERHKGHEKKLTEALSKTRVDRKLLESQLKDMKAAARTKS